MSDPQNGADLLARIKPQMRVETTSVCLRPDVIQRWEENEKKLVAAQAIAAGTGRGERLAGGATKEAKAAKAEAERLAEEQQALEAEIEQTEVQFAFRAMSKDAWRALCDSHPPRKNNELDMYAGYNRDAVNDQAVRDCLIDPVFEDCAKRDCPHHECGSWQQLVKTINPSEWAELRRTVNSANQGVVDAPKSVLASQILSRRDSASRRRAAGE